MWIACSSRWNNIWLYLLQLNAFVWYSKLYSQSLVTSAFEYYVIWPPFLRMTYRLLLNRCFSDRHILIIYHAMCLLFWHKSSTISAVSFVIRNFYIETVHVTLPPLLQRLLLVIQGLVIGCSVGGSDVTNMSAISMNECSQQTENLKRTNNVTAICMSSSCNDHHMKVISWWFVIFGVEMILRYPSWIQMIPTAPPILIPVTSSTLSLTL